ncbi:hypothetical protein [Pseudomonas sp.]|uniref:hypothetical protein n=1 Tax=Pseudomonas sp. TaxID=306 RepID=UPI003266E799
MSIKNPNKMHLKVGSVEPQIERRVPESDDPLIFWVLNQKFSMCVDLYEFAIGREAYVGSGIQSGFSGRPYLINQLAPILNCLFNSICKRVIQQFLSSLRGWWRLFDEIEKKKLPVLKRLGDVRDINVIHCEFARRAGMSPDGFSLFIKVVNLCRKSLQYVELIVEAPDRPTVQRYLPPENDTKILRNELKKVWEDTRRRWALIDEFSTGFIPSPGDDSRCLFEEWLYTTEVSERHEVVLPSPDQLRDAKLSSFTAASGFSIEKLYASKFITRWDVNSAFHICLATTGWNQAVLLALDASNIDDALYSHPQDSSQFVLCGRKVRSGGALQITTGLWKTSWGAGYVLKLLESKTRILRVELAKQIEKEKIQYNLMENSGCDCEQLLFKSLEIQKLIEGHKSCWLYVDSFGRINWLNESLTTRQLTVNNKVYTFLMIVIGDLNSKRRSLGLSSIGYVTPSDFRDIFSLFHWRQTGGNVLALMRMLNHSRLQTTSRYIDNNIINQQCDLQIQKLVGNVFLELEKGRLDLTILAHMQQYGPVSPEMEFRLSEFRKLEKSRIGTGCKKPFQPPLHIQVQSESQTRCSNHRCMVCPENCIVLPESLDGLAMRSEELLAIQESIPLELWLVSDFRIELANCLSALELFSTEAVSSSRMRWRSDIASGVHSVPGLTSHRGN